MEMGRNPAPSGHPQTEALKMRRSIGLGSKSGARRLDAQRPHSNRSAGNSGVKRRRPAATFKPSHSPAKPGEIGQGLGNGSNSLGNGSNFGAQRPHSNRYVQNAMGRWNWDEIERPAVRTSAVTTIGSKSGVWRLGAQRPHSNRSIGNGVNIRRPTATFKPSRFSLGVARNLAKPGEALRNRPVFGKWLEI